MSPSPEVGPSIIQFLGMQFFGGLSRKMTIRFALFARPKSSFF
jgi:hypothetical protein